MSDQADTRRFGHLGEVVMYLRQTAGLTRAEFGEQTKLGAPVVKAFETGKLRLSVEALQRILRHPAMAEAHRLAQGAGIKPRDPAPGDQGGRVEGDKP